MKKWIALAVVFAALLGLVGWRLYQKRTAADGGKRTRSAVVAVEVAPVTQGAIRDVAQFTGTLTARSHFVMAPKIAGRLHKLHVDIGDKVRRGQVIAELDAQEYREEVSQARAELAVAKANVDECQSTLKRVEGDFTRAKTLHAKGIASEAELEAATTQFQAQQARAKVVEAQVMQKEAALKSAEVRLSYAQMCAAWEGADGDERLVGERFADESAMLRANDPIVSIIDIRSLTAVMHVIERDYTKVRPGQKVAITADAFPGRIFEGTVARMAPVLREGSRQARVEIEVQNPKLELKPGMFIRADVEFIERQNATLAPVTALVKRNHETGVFLADTQENKVKWVPVTVGIVSQKHAEIVQPALSGTVVTLGQHLLNDGTAITIPGASPDAAPAGAPKTKGKPGRKESR